MSYTKTNWVNNTTPIDKDNLNKIEQGIYDNSLVVDAVTNTLNPTDTETYKTAELTEGQITDVIGVNDIVIKGDTEQDGTPTPSTPIAVNVVSGSNVVNTSNKNLFDKNTEIKGKLIVTTTGGIQDNSAWNISQFIPVKSGTELCFSYQTQGKGQIELVEYDKNQNILGGEAPSITQKYTKTISNNTKFVRVGYRNDLTCDNLQLEYGSNRTTYEPHQGKELPLDLPVVNLFDKDNETYTNGYINGSSATTLSNSSYNRTLYIPCKPNTTYAIQKMVSKDNSKFMIASSVDVPAAGVNIYNVVDAGTYNIHAIYTTSNNAKYLLVTYMQTNLTSTTVAEMLNSIQIEQGSKVNAYTPFGTKPIKLCKIGNYQDYFYKSGSKWYLHKEIEKYKFTGDENWTKSGSNNDYYELVSSSILHISNAIGFCNRYKQTTILNGNLNTEVGISIYLSNNLVRIRPQDNLLTNITDFKNDLSSNETILYYPLKEKTDTEITDTTLISQLEAIYNAPLYEETNITQENNDLPMVLDITACKDNINGIKAFIRK